ncbi:MAG: crosslink repair DNA glycosylase YcaQ family protein, partial [Gaiellaceae bacterium]
MTAPLKLTRAQILAFRRRVGALDRRLPAGERSLRQAAWAGIQDSMPRAALLSIHARVEGVNSAALEDSSLAQVWGPRYHVYVVAARDHAVFTLGRLPDQGMIRDRADDLAARAHDFLGGRKLGYGEVGQALGTHGNNLRYAALTGTLAIRWEGARQPTVWTVPAPEIEAPAAARELARRYLRVFGPARPDAFA